MHALDPKQSIYLGNMIYYLREKFAHGGTGFVLSRPALENLVMEYETYQTIWDEYVDENSFGDAILGWALNDIGARFIGAAPIFQGAEVGSVPYDRPGYWCRPTVSYHHLSPEVVESMWLFEQDYNFQKGEVSCSSSLH